MQVNLYPSVYARGWVVHEISIEQRNKFVV
jgi:hypothetical protein